MRGAIIAAGHGTRLAPFSGGIPKPLVEFDGSSLLVRILNEFVSSGIKEAFLVTNPVIWPPILRELENHGLKDYVHPLVKHTESGFKSVLELRTSLSGEPFLLSVCDIVFREGTMREFLAWTLTQRFDLAIAVTSTVRNVTDPVNVSVSNDGKVQDLGRDIADSGNYTAGFYVFSPGVFNLESLALRTGCTSLWQLLKLVVHQVPNVIARDVGEVFDVNTKEDYARAFEALVENRIAGNLPRGFPNAGHKETHRQV